MRIRWLVCTVESKAYLREYNVVGVRLCMYISNCSCIYIGKLNTLNQALATYGTRAMCGTWNDFQWHAE